MKRILKKRDVNPNALGGVTLRTRRYFNSANSASILRAVDLQGAMVAFDKFFAQGKPYASTFFTGGAQGGIRVIASEDFVHLLPAHAHTTVFK